ncbi:TPA: hypothetical protein ACG0AR_000134 [Elizabethkingia anophelis]|nr:hypothetical protein [Elizabethkingia anophelis]MDV3683926.1 hypothetical protein [Elizabethkingia anophelis]MDV3699549.1 hypothetical protein [Elizabethkingia anophelis]MDV3761950.1 hypothetical protein [Elizabethkingia anophelis]MDV3800667.1 hypothetical protein [Elizabethkingia anophelis]
MYHTILPVTDSHNPIIVEGESETKIIIFNAGPSTIEAQVWQNWKGKVDGKYLNSEEPNLQLELRAGNQKIISGSFIRARIKNSESDYENINKFAAVGVRILMIHPDNRIFHEYIY